ncbi:MAG: serine protease inhibitor [Cyanobacteria bacterium K_DeepCast_35m_m2_155]|nr:serine protease inhibitor [Cyanobacteria bacterium K_DeepCast_35m_m2_155]
MVAAFPADTRLARARRRDAVHPAGAAQGLPQGLGPAWAPALLAVLLASAAVLLAPEQPHDQAAICQRHNGAAACRVW